MVTSCTSLITPSSTIAAALEVYELNHEAAACFVYRYNPAAIRVKIIDPIFHGWSKANAMIMPGGFYVVYLRISWRRFLCCCV